MKLEELRNIKNWHTIVVSLKNGKLYHIEKPNIDARLNILYGEFVREIIDASTESYGSHQYNLYFELENINYVDYKISMENHLKSESFTDKLIIIAYVVSIIISLKFCK